MNRKFRDFAKRRGIEIVDSVPADEDNILICISVEEAKRRGHLPMAGSLLFPCSDCNEDVWLSPASQKNLHMIKAVVCNKCSTARMTDAEKKAVEKGETIKTAVLVEDKDEGGDV